MQDHEKTKEQLLEELLACRQRMAALQRAETESHSDRKRVEAALEQERSLLHTLMDHLPDNIYFKDAASRFIRISKAMATLFGLGDPAEAVGKTDFDFFTDEHARQAMGDEEEILRSGRAVINKEEKETWPDGHTTWTLTTKMPLCDEQGRTVGTFGLSRDVTERRRAAEALQRAKEEAEAASRAKSTFLANTSHEIRTPLNAIMGMTELVLKTQLTPRQREFLATVRDSGEALLAVINDILDFSRIEAGKLVLERQTFDLRESLGDTMKSFAIAAAAQGLELACFIHPDVPRVVVGDYGRLRQIVVNLVGNAVKFTQQGEVILEVGLEPPSGNGGPAAGAGQDVTLHFMVGDTGMGIPEERRSAIFEMFEQADNSMTRRYGGAGLGLAIASRLAGLMQGRIWVQSEVGRGSEFHFTARLGLAEPEVVQAIPPEPSRLHGVRVLAVDDNATNRRLLEEILRGWRMVPASAGSARQALALIARAREAGEPYDLVLTDAHMPDVRRLHPGRRDPPRPVPGQHRGDDAHLGRPPRGHGTLRPVGHRRVPAQTDQTVGAAGSHRAGPGDRGHGQQTAPVGPAPAPPRRSPAHLAGRGQPDQPEAGRGLVGGRGTSGHRGPQRPPGDRRTGQRRLRPGGDGRADAGNGRTGGHGDGSAPSSGRPVPTRRSSP